MSFMTKNDLRYDKIRNHLHKEKERLRNNQRRFEIWTVLLRIISCKQRFDHLFKTLKRLGSNDPNAIDQEDRRALDTQLPRQFYFLLNNGCIFSRVQALIKTFLIQA